METAGGWRGGVGAVRRDSFSDLRDCGSAGSSFNILMIFDRFASFGCTGRDGGGSWEGALMGTEAARIDS